MRWKTWLSRILDESFGHPVLALSELTSVLYALLSPVAQTPNLVQKPSTKAKPKIFLSQRDSPTIITVVISWANCRRPLNFGHGRQNEGTRLWVVRLNKHGDLWQPWESIPRALGPARRRSDGHVLPYFGCLLYMPGHSEHWSTWYLLPAPGTSIKARTDADDEKESPLLKFEIFTTSIG